MNPVLPATFVRWAFYVYVISLPFEIPERTIPFEVHTVTGVVLLLAALLQPRVCFRAPCAAFWWYVAYFFVYVVLGVYSTHTSEWIRDSLIFLQLLLLFWVTVNVMRPVTIARTALLLFAASCCVLALLQRLGFTATVAEVGDVAERMTALGQNPNTFAHNMSIGLLVLVGLTYGSHAYPSLRIAILPACALLGITIMPTAARGALLTLMIGLVVTVLAHGDADVKMRNSFVAVLLLAGLSMAAYRADGMRNRLLLAAESNDFALREQLFPAAWQMFVDKPLVGWGPVNNRYELEKHVPRAEVPYRETHNVVLELLTEVGLIGAAPFLIAMILSVYSAWRARNGPHGVTPFVLVITVLVARMSTAGVYTKTHWLLLAFAVASDVQSELRPRYWGLRAARATRP